jgi:hypothetical protein
MNKFTDSTNYVIEISEDQLKKILAADDSALQGDTLHGRLRAIPGVKEFDYNDLSASISLTVYSTFDHQLTWEKIWDAIRAIGGRDNEQRKEV